MPTTGALRPLRWSRPGRVELSHDRRYLEWRARPWKKTNVAGFGRRMGALLPAFLWLGRAETTPEDVLRFAQRWGVLESRPGQERGRERVERWLESARRFEAALDARGALLAHRPETKLDSVVPQQTMERLFGDRPGKGTYSTSWHAVQSALVLVSEQILADIQLFTFWSDQDGLGLRIGGGSLASGLAAELLRNLASDPLILRCGECRAYHVPKRRPAPGTQPYCLACQRGGAALRRAKRRYNASREARLHAASRSRCKPARRDRPRK